MNERVLNWGTGQRSPVCSNYPLVKEKKGEWFDIFFNIIARDTSFDPLPNYPGIKRNAENGGKHVARVRVMQDSKK